MKKLSLKILALLALLLAFVSMSYAIHLSSPANSQEQKTTSEQSSFVFTAEKDGQTALDLIEKYVKIHSKKYSFGVMVLGVNGHDAPSDSFWAFYVNGKLANKGVSNTVLHKGDKVELKLEKIKK